MATPTTPTPNGAPIIPQGVNANSNQPSLESIFGTSAVPSNRPALADILGTKSPTTEAPHDSPDATIVDKAKSAVGGATEGLGATIALPAINWVGRKAVEALPDGFSFQGISKQQMLHNLDHSPTLQKQFETAFGKEKAPDSYKTGEIAGNIAGLAVPVYEGANMLAKSKVAGAISDAFQGTRDFAVGTKDAVISKAKDISPFHTSDKLTEIASSPEVHPFIASSPENAKVVGDAVKQGFEPRDIKFLSTINEADKPAVNEMLNLAEKGTGDLRAQYAGKRPADVVGDSILQPLKSIQKINQASGEAVDSTARSLAGEQVDATEVGKTAKNVLERAGVTEMSPEDYQKALAKNATDGGKVPSRWNYDASVFKKLPAVQKQLDNALSDLPSGPMDAYDLHNFKKSIDQIVEYGKSSSKPLTREAENVLKEIRASADNVLDTNFEAYNKANTDYKETKDLLDHAHEVMGQKTDFLSSNANMRVGQATRQLFNNGTKRQDMFNFLQKLQETSVKHGVEVKSNPVDQALFAQVLESVYGTPAITGLQGETSKAIKTAMKFKTNPLGATIETAGNALDKMQNISPEEKKRVLQAFVKMGESSGKSFNLGTVPETVGAYEGKSVQKIKEAEQEFIKNYKQANSPEEKSALVASYDNLSKSLPIEDIIKIPEKGSGVVEGAIYHGTSAEDAKSIIKNGVNTDISSKMNKRGSVENPGEFFASKETVAQNDHSAGTYGDTLVKVTVKKGQKLNMLSPEEWKASIGKARSREEADKVKEMLRARGFDGSIDQSGEYQFWNTDKLDFSHHKAN